MLHRSPTSRQPWLAAVLAVVLLCASCSSSSLVADDLPQPADAPASASEPTPQADTAPAADPTPAGDPTPNAELTAEPIPQPTAEPEVDSAPEPTATEPDAPTEPALQIPVWEEIIAAEQYTPIEQVISSSADWQPAIDGGSFRTWDRTDDGQIINGEFIRRYPSGAMTQTLAFDIDPATGYAYGFADGFAEPNDGGCFQQVVDADGAWTRDSFDGPLGDFQLDPEALDLFALLSAPDDERLASRLWELLERTPTVDELADGWARQFASLDADQATRAANEFANTRSDFGGGYFEAIVAPDETMRSFTVWVTGLGVARTFDDGTVGVDSTTVYLHSVLGPFQEPELRVTPQTPPRETACKSPLADITGTWNLLSVLGGGTEVPTSLLDQMGDASVTFGDDGTITGTTGCQDFSGTINIDFDVLRDVDLSLTGTPCQEGDFSQDGLEIAFLAALTDSQRALIDLEDRLFLITAFDDEQVAIVFRRP